MANTTKLDFQQIIKKVYDEGTESLKTTGAGGGGNNVTIVDVTSTSSLPVTEDFTVLASIDTDNANINGSGGAFTEVITSLADDCVMVSPYETTGKKIGVYIGAAASETLLFIVGPGQDMPVRVDLMAGTRISIKSTEVTGPSSGSLILTFHGRV